MDFKSTLVLSILFVTCKLKLKLKHGCVNSNNLQNIPDARAQLVCYHCENCKRDAAVIQPCGFDDPILTPPNFTTLPGGDFNDPNSPILTAPTVPGNGGGGNGDSGNSGNPGDPILTPPTYPGDNNNNNGGSGTANPLDPILTPPSLPGDIGNGGGSNGDGGGNPWEPILTPPPSWGVRSEQSGQYVCLMAKSIGKGNPELSLTKLELKYCVFQ